MKRLLFRLTAILLTLLLAGIGFSPYRRQAALGCRAIAVSVDIAAPPEQVFAYLGNSAHARDWSSYVDHITPLNPQEVPDGAVGSLRRCFRDAAEQGERWDEEIMAVTPARRRRLTIFNLQNFAVGSPHLLTEQRYASLPEGGCRLTFSLFLNEQADWADALKMYFAAYVIAPIFRTNLQNIKALNEAPKQ